MTPAIPTSLRSTLTKPVAVFGRGVSGEGVLALLEKWGVPAIVYDRTGTPFTPEVAVSHGLVVFAPGFPPNHPWLVTAVAAGLECLGELDFASLFWRGRIVAVTGTNGKTTLTEFLTHALRQAGENAHATGNIGRPLARLVVDRSGGTDHEIAVCEVSSFQAETMQHFHADATLWTNFAEDHLERHPGLEAYFSAKWNLVVRTTEDGFFAGSSVIAHARKFNRTLPRSAWVETEGVAADPRLEATVFANYPQRENYLLAAAWWRASGREPAELAKAADSFRLGRHRMTRVGAIDGATYWNDSKATNFHAVEAAVSQFDRPVLLIAGGRTKGGGLSDFVKRLAPAVREIFLIGEVSAELAAACVRENLPHVFCETLREAVQRAAEQAGSGDHVVLSPGFASFDMFHDYQDRGHQFEQFVQELGKTANLR